MYGADCEVRTYTHQGVGEVNEDALVVSPGTGLFAVLDGATALGELRLPGALAAAAAAEALRDSDPSLPLLSRVHAANDAVRAASSDFLRRNGAAACAPDELPGDERSSCGLAAVRLLEGARMEFVHAGDCMAFMQYRNGDVRALTYDRIAALDDVAVAAGQQQAVALRSADAMGPDAAASVAAMRDHVMPILRRHRRLLNTPGGYAALDGTAGAMQRLETGVVDVGDVTGLLLLSDGLQLPSGSDAAAVWLDSACYAFERGLAALADHIHALEQSDPACLLYPRLKPADDKSGIQVTLKKR
jgi:hypothetical protein